MPKTNIKRIAEIVRKEIQRECVEDPSSIGDGDDLFGACGYAAYGLSKVLPGSELVLGEYEIKGGVSTHAWIEIDNQIIDITATQFGVNTKVHIVTKTESAARKYRAQVKGRKARAELKLWNYPKNWQKNLPRRLKRIVRGKKCLIIQKVN